MVRTLPFAAAALIAACLTGPALAQDLQPFATVPDTALTAAQKASSIIGARAYAAGGEEVGTVSDILFDWREPGRVIGYTVSSGGFFGIDEAHLFVPTDRSEIRIDGQRVSLIMDIEAAVYRTDAQLD